MQAVYPPGNTYARDWCADLAVGTQEAIATITGAPSYLPIREKFQELFAVSDDIARACPARMGGAANMDLLYYICEHIQACAVVETGVSYGWSSLAILLSLANRPGASLVSTDIPYDSPDAAESTGCVVPDALRHHWQIIKLPDRQGLPKALESLPSIDVCHYDSDKSYDARLWAYSLLWKALRGGGWFISDDVGDNLGFHDFCSGLGLEPLIVETSRRDPQLKKYVGAIPKL